MRHQVNIERSGVVMRQLALSALCAAVVGGAALSAAPVQAKGPSLLSFGVGQFDTDVIDTGSAGLFFDSGDKAGKNKAVEARLEYRFGTELWSTGNWFAIRPFVGASTTSDGMIYGLGGLLFDFTWGNFVFTPSFGAGGWSRGDGKDLGYGLEFRTMFEVGWRFENEARVTAAFSHMSNAEMGDKNPGANSLMLYLHLPVGTFLGN
jgi:lipid A 3-O-deacylase